VAKGSRFRSQVERPMMRRRSTSCAARHCDMPFTSGPVPPLARHFRAREQRAGSAKAEPRRHLDFPALVDFQPAPHDLLPGVGMFCHSGTSDAHARRGAPRRSSPVHAKRSSVIAALLQRGATTSERDAAFVEWKIIPAPGGLTGRELEIFQSVVLPGLTHSRAVGVGDPPPRRYVDATAGVITANDGSQGRSPRASGKSRKGCEATPAHFTAEPVCVAACIVY
jgi:hypothetical protein